MNDEKKNKDKIHTHTHTITRKIKMTREYSSLIYKTHNRSFTHSHSLLLNAQSTQKKTYQ